MAIKFEPDKRRITANEFSEIAFACCGIAISIAVVVFICCMLFVAMLREVRQFDSDVRNQAIQEAR